MTSYITLDGLKTRFDEQELIDIAGQGGRDFRTLDEARIETEIDYTNNLVAGYVARRFPDLDPVPEVLEGASADIVRYRLRVRAHAKSTIAEEVRRRYDAALALLKDIQSGKFDLRPGSNSDPSQVPSLQQGQVLGYHRPSRAKSALESYR